MGSFAGWDIKSFLENGTTYIKEAGSLLIVLMGTIAVVWGVVLLFKKLMGSQQGPQDPWWKIAGLIILGGAAIFGGGALFFNIAQGGQKTVTDLGGGVIPVLLGMI